MKQQMPEQLWMRPDDPDDPDFMPEITSSDDVDATMYVRADLAGKVVLGVTKDRYEEDRDSFDESFKEPCGRCVHRDGDEDSFPCAVCEHCYA